MHPTLISHPQNAGGQSNDSARARRASCRIGGIINHPTLPHGLNVLVRDTSVAGAKLEVADAKGNPFAASTERIPERFTLVMPMDRISVECRVAWRKGHTLGVRYMGPTRQIPKRQNAHLDVKPQKRSLLAQILG